MSRSSVDDFPGLFSTFVIVGMLLVIALLVSYVALIAIPAYVGYRLWKESPPRLERLAREETEVLYRHALAGQAKLSEDEIDDALCRHWPPDLPGPLRTQLLDVGEAILADEGLTPEVPPMPALCNTVEGARYRDMLARPAMTG